jgi:hypothetical protein
MDPMKGIPGDLITLFIMDTLVASTAPKTAMGQKRDKSVFICPTTVGNNSLDSLVVE